MQYLLKLNAFKVSSLLLLIVFIAVACATYKYGITGSIQDDTLAGTYNKMIDLDKKHNATFRQETIPKKVLRLEKISPLIDDLKILLNETNSTDKDGDLTAAKLRLIQGRIDMLQAEESLQVAMGMGKQGVLKQTFICSESQDIKKQSYYFNQTNILAAKALGEFDSVLSKYVDFREVFGVNDDKIEFYNSDTTEYRQIAAANIKALAEKCPDAVDS